MKSELKITIATLLLSGFTTPALSQMSATKKAGTSVKTTASLSMVSSYIDRGNTSSDGPCLQPGISLGFDQGVSFTTNGNFALTENNDDHGENRFTQVNLIIGYALPVPSDVVNVSVGVGEYLYPNSDFDSLREATVTAGIKAPLNPTLFTGYMVDGPLDGNIYSELGLSQNILTRNDLSVGLSAGAAYNQAPDNGDAGITHGKFGGNIGYKTITASAIYYIETDEDLIKYSDNKDNRDFLVSVGTSRTF